MAKEASVIVLDINTRDLDLGISAARAIVQQKLLFTKRDEIGLVLVGTQQTANPSNLRAANEYLNITVGRDIQVPKLTFLESFSTIESEQTPADVIDGVVVAAELLVDRVQKLKFSKRIWLVTDAVTPIAMTEQLGDISDMLRGQDCTLNIIGCGFVSPPDEIEEDEDQLRQWFEQQATEQNNPALMNQYHLRSLVKTCGVVLPADDALSVLTQVRSRTVNQVSLFRGALQIGSLGIQVYAFAKTKTANMPTLSKFSTLAPVDADGELQGTVKMSRTYWNKLGDQAEEVDDEHRVQAYSYGKEKLPAADHIRDALKYKADKCLVALGFLDLTRLPRHLYMSSVDVVVAAPGDSKSAVALSAMARACLAGTGVMRGILVRFVKRQNSAPKLGILTPVVEPDLEGFYFNQLPFSEDVRSFSFATLNDKRFEVSEQQQQAARDLITSMDLTQQQLGDDAEELLVPEQTYNPAIQRFYAFLQAKAFDEQAEPQPLDESLRRVIEPDLDPAAALTSFARAFPLQPCSSDAKSKKRHWRDIMTGSSVASSAASMFQLPVSNEAVVVSSVDPIGSFMALVEQHGGQDERVADIVQQFWTIIGTSVINSFGDHAFARALACIQTARSSCVQRSATPVEFNQQLRQLVEKCRLADRTDFIDVMRAKFVRPIDSTENRASDISPAEADSFFAPLAQAAVAQAAAVQDDNDDPFDNMD